MSEKDKKSSPLPASAARLLAELPADQRSLGTYQVARLLGIEQSTVRRWVRAGKVAAVRLPGKLAISRASLEAFLTRSEGADRHQGPFPKPRRQSP